MNEQIQLTEIFEAVNITPHGHYYFVYIPMCTISKYIGINREKKYIDQTKNL